MKHLSIIFSISFSLFLLSCAATDDDMREDTINIINNSDIMVDVTEGQVILSGYVFNADDTIGFHQKITNIKGVKSLENNISVFDKSVVD